MTVVPKSRGAAAPIPESSTHWEKRSAGRVLELGRDQILQRSWRIVDAANDLLDTEGLEGLTIRAVLKKTGLSRRAFYERFEGKDDLLLAVFEHSIRLAVNRYEEAFRSLPDPMERVKQIVTSIALGEDLFEENGMHYHRRGAALSREHLRLAESRPADLQAALSPLIEFIARQLAEGMTLGVVRNTHPQQLAVLVYNLVSTTAHAEFLAQEITPQERTHRLELATAIWEFCRRAIAA